MTRLTDRGFYAAVTLAAATFLAACTLAIPTLGPVLVIAGTWTVVAVTLVGAVVWVGRRL